MDSLDTKLTEVNKKFKANALTGSIINILILGLIFVFFSIGFDLTKKLVLDFFNLSWATIFPSILDLGTIAGLIFLLKGFLDILKQPDFFISVDDNDTEATSKVEKFLKNHHLNNLEITFFCLIALSCVNFVLNAFFESANDQFSTLNEWYFSSTYFTELPIFPINLICIFIVVGLFLPIMLNYAKYKEEVSKIYNIKTKSDIDNIKSYRFWTLVALSVFCIIMSFLQRFDAWIFQYKNPIATEDVLRKKLDDEGIYFCKDNFKQLHGKDVIVHNVVKIKAFTGQEHVRGHTYPITPELKEKIQAIQKECLAKEK